MGFYQVQLVWIRVDLGVMAMKGSSIFPKASGALWSFTIKLLSIIFRKLAECAGYPSAEMQSCILQSLHSNRLYELVGQQDW